ncbi:MAG: CsoS2 family carboxysome shell protein [Acidiferrobacter sp.]
MGIAGIENNDQAVTTSTDGVSLASQDLVCPPHDTGTAVRDLCRKRRQRLSVQGKGAAVRELGRGTAPIGQRPNVSTGIASGRELARQRRALQCQHGCGNASAGRSNEQSGSNMGAPSKVVVGTTLAGQPVTGTQVERTPRVTGNEAGTCRVITGTEYISTEQFESFCKTRPAPGVAKVGTSITSHGRRVSGSELGRSVRVTGDEHGSCKPVTGTEYLGRERFGEFCENKGLVRRPEKVSVGITERAGVAVSGSDEARINHATGAEAGAMRAITGSPYADMGIARLTINGPRKVALTHTLAGRPVSGTEVGRSTKVTGDEAGACRVVSGTEYLSNEQFSSICHTRPEPTPAKGQEDTSRAGQRITGNVVDHTDKVTGNEPGICQRVTGAQYEQPALCGGREGATETPAPADQPVGGRIDQVSQSTGDGYDSQDRRVQDRPRPPLSAAAKVGTSYTDRGVVVSGSLLGRSDRVTGDEPGSGLRITGTAYSGREQPGGARQGGGTAPATEVARAMPPRYRASPRPTPPLAESAGESLAAAFSRPDDFSIVSPAREAHRRITGSAYGGAGRITGPVNMATGLVSGTPEFRYRDDAAAPVPVPAPVQAEKSVPALRITGAGRETGQRITGDDWARNGRVTGTEGRWAHGRNPTLKGRARGAGATASANKDREHADVPPAKVTGSSGNAAQGALITVSGGARG